MYLKLFIKKVKKTKNSVKPKKRELNVSADKKTALEIQIFSDFQDEKKGFLAVCDIFWINFSEQDVFNKIYFFKKNIILL